MSVAELTDIAADPYADEDLAIPLIAVAVDTVAPTMSEDHISRLHERVRAMRVVSVGVLGEEPGGAASQLAAAFDILVTPQPGTVPDTVAVADVGAEITQLAEVVATHPHAAVAAAQLLRMGPWAPDRTSDGLVAESLTYSTLQSGPEFADWLAKRTPLSDPAAHDGPRVLARRDMTTLHLAFNRPERHNAYDSATRDELVALLRMAATDPSLDGVVLTGDGPSFCSGGDLNEFGTAPDPASAHAIRTQRSAAYWMDRLGGRARVELHGACIGAGIEVPAYAGTVLARTNTRIRLPEIALGLVPGAGGTVSIPRRIGRRRTCWLSISGAEIGVETARRWGLVDRII